MYTRVGIGRGMLIYRREYDRHYYFIGGTSSYYYSVVGGGTSV
jgi:hypothetical protein